MFRFRTTAVVPSIAALFFAVGLLASGPDQVPSSIQPQGQVVAPAVRDGVAIEGSVRVLVLFRLSEGVAAAEAQLGNAQAILTQRQDFASMRTRVLARMAAGTARETRRYQTLPLMALEVGPAALAALESSPDVARVIPDALLRPSLQHSVPRIEGDQAWQAGYDGAGTAIAILDTGVDAAHPFLGGRVIKEACFSSAAPGLSQSLCPNGTSNQTGAGAAAPCQFDGCEHGTHVAGIAAGNGEAAGQPFSGVAKGAKIVAVQVFSRIVDSASCGGSAPCPGAFVSDIIAGLEHVYALKVGGLNVASANLSLGGGSFEAPCDSEPFKPAIDNLRALGVASVAAAGNDAGVATLSTPACVSTAVSVGATTLADEVAWFSNVAPFLSLVAPGADVVSSVPGGGYAAFSGTSMAAPFVAGAWAAIRQAAPDAGFDDMLDALRSTGQPVTDLRSWAPGSTTLPRLRTFAALTSIAPVKNPSPKLKSVAPAIARAGVPLTLTLVGTGFNSQSVARWNGADVPTVAEGATQLRAEVPAGAIAIGTALVSVFNPSPGGGTSAALPVTVLAPPTLAVDKTTAAPGAEVTVTLSGGYGGQLDFLALAASTSPDTNYVASTYVGKDVTDRTWTVVAPSTPASYEFRLFLGGEFVRAATSPAFTVDAAISPAPVATSMSPTQAGAGSAALTLTVQGSNFVAASVVAWNGAARPTTFVSSTQLRATIPAADLETAGSVPVTIVTPAPGGGTSAPLTFTVIPAPALAVSATTVNAGSTVTVTLTNGYGGSTDWLAFAPVGAATNSYLQFTYVGVGVTTRTWTVTAPATAGQYEFRLFRQGSFSLAATSPAVTVQAAPPILAVSAATVAAGQAVTVTLTNGLGGSTDWLSFGATGAADSGYLQFTYVGAGVTTRTWTVTAPSTTGTFEFRLFRQGSFVRLATSPAVSVSGPPPPSPTLAVNQTTVAPGSSVTATLANSPGGASDFLALAATGAPDTSYLQSVGVGAGVTTRTWTVSMPAASGTYEFRLFVVANGITSRAATSPVVAVQVPTTPVPELAVGATTVPVGQPLTVTLTNGPGGSQDWLALAAVGAANTSYVQFTYVGAGVTTRTWTVAAPSAAGQYEFRLFRQGTFVRVATSAPVTVQAAPSPVLTVSSTSAAPGQAVTVTLTNGPGGSTDWLAFAQVGAPDSAYLRWTYVGAGVTTRTWTVVVPAAPGNYEFRLYRQGSFVRVATSPTVRVGGSQ